MAQTIEVPGIGPVQFPDGMSDADIGAAIRKTLAPKPQQEASAADKVAAFPLTRFAIGAAKPVLGAAQFAANLLPTPAPTMSQLITGEKPQNSVAKAVNDHLATLEEMTQRGSKTKWGTGGEVADFAGQVLSPVNVAAAKLLPVTGGIAAQAGKGAVLGAAGAATAPVMDKKGQENYWETKGADTALGAVTGGVATPLLGKLGEAIARRLPQSTGQANVSATQTSEIIANALKDIGQKIEDIPKAQYQQIQAQVTEALKSGKKLDAAALLRQADFKEAGMPALAGQVTRDATQFAKERNLRGVAGVGEPLLQRMEQQNKALQSGIGGFAEGASDAVTAGERMAAALKSTDEGISKQVSAAYKAARQSSGKDLEVPLTGLAQDAADTLKRFADKVPAGVRNELADYGVFGGKQTKMFTFEDADRLLKNINAHVGSDKATNNALGELRTAVKKAMMDAPADDVYSKARNLAAKRFELHDLVPALKAASEDTVSADAFVRRFVTSAPTKDVQMMAQLLKQASPEALQEARTQVGARLQRAAFGENVAGDKIFSPERYATALREIGDKKLGAFFNEAEIAQLKRLGRVGAYINSVPSAAPVSSSNSNIASMVANYGAKLPMVGPAVSVAKAAAGPILNQRTVNTAINAKVPVENAPLSPERAKALARLLGVGAVGGGLAVAQP